MTAKDVKDIIDKELSRIKRADNEANIVLTFYMKNGNTIKNQLTNEGNWVKAPELIGYTPKEGEEAPEPTVLKIAGDNSSKVQSHTEAVSGGFSTTITTPYIYQYIPVENIEYFEFSFLTVDTTTTETTQPE